MGMLPDIDAGKLLRAYGIVCHYQGSESGRRDCTTWIAAMVAAAHLTMYGISCPALVPENHVAPAPNSDDAEELCAWKQGLSFSSALKII